MNYCKYLKDFYKGEMDNIEIPPCPFPANNTGVNQLSVCSIIFKLVFAAAIAASFIPLIYGTANPSPLAVRAASVCKNYSVEARISKGLLDLHRIVSKSFFMEE